MSDLREEATGKSPVASRRRWWLWLPVGCFGLLLLAFLTGVSVVSIRARSRWKEFRQRHAQLSARVQGRAVEREPLEGPATEGNSFDRYLVFAEGLSKMSLADRNAIDKARLGDRGPEAERQAFAVLDAHAADLEGIRKASRLSWYRDPMDWKAGWAAKFEWLRPFRHAVGDLDCSAMRRRKAGDLDGAIDDVAAMAQLGVDTGSSGPLTCYLAGGNMLHIAVARAGELAADPALTPAQAARLERLFTRAEAALRPLEDALEAEHLSLNETLLAVAEGRLSTEELGFPTGVRALAWRHGFSWRVVAADVDDACTRVSAEAGTLSSRPWDEASKAYGKNRQEWSRDTFCTLLNYAESSMIDRFSRTVRAKLRLIRTLAHERASGAPPAPVPDDPFTMKALHHRDAADSSLWWSEWTDGDQGGAGKFQEPEGTGDIVLEWKRARK